MIQLNQRSKTPLYEQIYEQLQADIACGAYPGGSKLPSIRALSDDLNCSKNTVDAAYRLLMQEGYVWSKPGSGFVVERVLPDSFRIGAEGGEQRSSEGDPQDDQGLSPAQYDFTYGNLQEGTFPALVWKSLTSDVLLGTQADRANSYTDSAGELSLRAEIARSLAAQRGVQCRPEQVIVQSGTQAAVQNLLLLFNPATDTVAMENPGYDGVRTVFERNRFALHPCPVCEGLDAYLAAVRASNAKLVYTTPSSQFPTGTVMPLDTRMQLIEWARDQGAYLLEDDYCHEFRYGGRPVPSFQSLDRHGRVIYMGTFSKSLSPALRMNYLILPENLLERWLRVFSNAYPSVPWLSQEVLCRFLRDGQRDRLLRRVQNRNRRKYEALTKTLRSAMGDRVDIMEGGAGLHLLVNVRDGRSQGELIAAAREAGVRVYSTDRYWMTENHPLASCVLVGFSAIEEEAIEPGVKALARAWFG